jgi:hypothetical protein
MPFWRISLFNTFRSRVFSRRRRAAFAHWFAPRKPRHPLLRAIFGLTGLVLLLVLVMFGLVVGALMLSATLAMRLFRRRGDSRSNESRNLSAEYRVLRKAQLPTAPLPGSR